jgi:hypothetical protein
MRAWPVRMECMTAGARRGVRIADLAR